MTLLSRTRSHLASIASQFMHHPSYPLSHPHRLAILLPFIVYLASPRYLAPSSVSRTLGSPTIVASSQPNITSPSMPFPPFVLYVPTPLLYYSIGAVVVVRSPINGHFLNSPTSSPWVLVHMFILYLPMPDIFFFRRETEYLSPCFGGCHLCHACQVCRYGLDKKAPM